MTRTTRVQLVGRRACFNADQWARATANVDCQFHQRQSKESSQYEASDDQLTAPSKERPC
jgi:hypothetical protein